MASIRLPALLLLLVATAWGQDKIITSSGGETKGKFIRATKDFIIYVPARSTSGKTQRVPRSIVVRVEGTDGKVLWRNPDILGGDYMVMKVGPRIHGKFAREDADHILFYRDGSLATDRRSWLKSDIRRVVLADNTVVWPPPKKIKRSTTDQSTSAPDLVRPLLSNPTTSTQRQVDTESLADRFLAMGVIALMIGAALYFIPTIIGGMRDASHQGAIFALNLLLGWTLIGWVGAIVWALADSKKQRRPGRSGKLIAANAVAGSHCPHCGAETVVPGATFCHACGKDLGKGR